MICIITGASHTGKTVLAQKLLRKYRIPYLSVDLIKMGLIRSKYTTLTPLDDEALEAYLWPVVKEIIETAIENGQDLIVEGCYMPLGLRKEFSPKYLPHIKLYCLVMTDAYLKEHFGNVKKYACAAELRTEGDVCDFDFLRKENRRYAKICDECGVRPVLIDKRYRISVDPAVVAESERMIFRRIRPSDFSYLCEMLQDPAVTYAWERPFADEEVRAWIKKRRENYRKFGYDYFLAIEKKTGKTVGQIGLLEETLAGKAYTGIGYMLRREEWGKGYATEGAKTMLDYAFRELGKTEIVADIRPENLASRRVAERLGMQICGECVKRFDGKEMPHLIYRLQT